MFGDLAKGMTWRTRDKIILGSSFAAGLVLVVLHRTELVAGGTLAVAIILGVAFATAAYLLWGEPPLKRRGRRGFVFTIIAAGALISSSVVPALSGFARGHPIVDREVHAAGDGIPIPAGTRGSFELVASVDFGESDGVVIISVAGTDARFEAMLERTTVRKVGAGGRRSRVLRDSVTQSVQIAEGTSSLTVERLQGSLPVRVVIYPAERLPRWLVPMIDAMVLLLAAIGVRRRALPAVAVPATAAAMGFSLWVWAYAAPPTAARIAASGLVMGLLPGLVVGWLIAYAVQSRETTQPRRSRRRRT